MMSHPSRSYRILPPLLALSLVVALSTPTSARSGAAVPASRLRRLSGVYTAVWKGHEARVKLYRDGRIRAVSENRFDEGRWMVRGDELCVSFKVWTKGRYKCGRVYRKGGWYEGLYKKNGRPRLRFRR